MASSSTGASSGSSGGVPMRNSGSEADLAAVDERKRKRKLSNRESARRSRMRKQKHVDDLTAQVAQLRKENAEMLTSVDLTTQLFLGVEADNSVLRAQAAELSHRLRSLDEIVNYVDSLRNGVVATATGSNTGTDSGSPEAAGATDECLTRTSYTNPWDYSSSYQPMTADMIMY